MLASNGEINMKKKDGRKNGAKNLARLTKFCFPILCENFAYCQTQPLHSDKILNFCQHSIRGHLQLILAAVS